MSSDQSTLSSAQFIDELKTHQSDKEREKNLRVVAHSEGTEVLGVRHKHVFDLARAFTNMPLEEVEKLLESPYYELRLGAVSIMDFQAKRKTTSEEHRKTLFDLYINRHDRLSNWDFVDRAAGRVVGMYLFQSGAPRGILYELARSDDLWERRTAIVATSYFIREGELDDTFQIAEILLDDDHDLIHKAVGGWVRHAGQKDRPRLLRFLDEHAATMPRTTLRYATEKMDKEQREHYRSLAKKQR